MKDFIITFIVAFVLFKVLRSFMFVRKAASNNKYNGDAQRPVGDISIEETEQSNNKSTDSGYADYEEIK